MAYGEKSILQHTAGSQSSPAPVGGRHIIGQTDEARQFAYVFFSSAGTGARPNKDGISATAFPSGLRGVPAEIIENVSPLFAGGRCRIRKRST